MATLAIKGHSTRGEEVIELLEMLGGWNYNRWDGKTSRTLYFINENVIELTNIRHDTCINEFNVFTLEEFEEQYPYKVGDNVTHHVGKLLETHKIIGMRWDSDKCRILYYLDNYDVIGVEDILYGIECKIEQSIKNNDNLTINSEEFEEKFPYKIGDKVLSHNKWEGIIIGMEWSNDDIVYHIRENTGYISHQSVNELQPYKEDTVEEEEEDFAECIEKTIQECLFGKEDMKEPKELLIGFTKDSEGDWILNTHKDYEIKEVDGKFKLVKKNPKYPKTYEECYDILGLLKPSDDDSNIFGYKTSILRKFQKLLICRDAYWKIAGEELGLGKPWKQDYDDRCFIIANNDGNIHTYEYHGTNNVILAFPAEEMRDDFYENFKDLIEDCKELL